MKVSIPGLRLFSHVFILTASALALLGVVMGAMVLSLPDLDQLQKCITTTMFKVKLCPGSSTYVPLRSISPFVVHAVIAAEDTTFYSHEGFDWHEIQESFNANLNSGRFRRGGSTLTQQLAKNLYLSQEKSLWRKLKEAYLAYAIEARYSKNFILEKYLNVVEFGPGLYGVKAAARHYFHKSPAELHPLEAAYLAFLLPNPKSHSRSSRKGELTPYARKMITVILTRMKVFRTLSEPAYETAMTSLNDFPWSGLTLASFEGRPNYDLNAEMTDEMEQEMEQHMERSELPVDFEQEVEDESEDPADDSSAVSTH
ncbi:MAG: biosynthetic peptidoglycan transglycosylase [Bdellovibrionales bacterium]